jgi:hypothetical protein
MTTCPNPTVVNDCHPAQGTPGLPMPMAGDEPDVLVAAVARVHAAVPGCRCRAIGLTPPWHMMLGMPYLGKACLTSFSQFRPASLWSRKDNDDTTRLAWRYQRSGA